MEPNIWLNTNEFMDFEKVSLKFTKDSIAGDLKKLDTIFVDNPNSWAKKATYYNIYSDDHLDFLKLLKTEKVTFYQFKYELPKDPKGHKNKEIMCELSSWSRARSAITLELYWLAYNFFIKRGYSLTHPYNTSTYLSIEKGDTILKRNVSRNMDKDVSPIKTIVRCGEIDASRIVDEIIRGLDSLWLFPHYYDEDIIDEKYLLCYLMTVNPETKDLIRNKDKARAIINRLPMLI